MLYTLVGFRYPKQSSLLVAIACNLLCLRSFWRFYKLKVALQINNTNVKYVFTLLCIFPVLNRVVNILFPEMCLQAYMKLPFEPFGIAL